MDPWIRSIGQFRVSQIWGIPCIISGPFAGPLLFLGHARCVCPPLYLRRDISVRVCLDFLGTLFAVPPFLVGSVELRR
jgi:hypothetical protein